jgi:3'(2'), 5'-bisphosphate nucleotidase
MNPLPSPFMQSLIDLAVVAGAEIMAIYATDFSAKAKGDLTPVTEADEAAEKIILAGLAKISAAVPVISEEAASAGRIPEVSERFFLVDPLDGTKEFISKNGEFTVNIALVENGVSHGGCRSCAGTEAHLLGRKGPGRSTGPYRRRCGGPLEGPRRPHASRRWCHRGGQPFPPRCRDRGLPQDGQGQVPVLGRLLPQVLPRRRRRGRPLPRFGRTMEWDTAAGHAVLLAAGGRVMTVDGAELAYGKRARGYDNPGFIASA